MSNASEKRPVSKSTKVVFGAVALLLIGGIGLGMFGLSTGRVDPMWAGVLWGSGVCLGLYGMARLGAAQAKPAITRAGEIVERAVLIRKTQTLKASQRFSDARTMQRRVDELTARLWPSETAPIAPLPSAASKPKDQKANGGHPR